MGEIYDKSVKAAGQEPNKAARKEKVERAGRLYEIEKQEIALKEPTFNLGPKLTPEQMRERYRKFEALWQQQIDISLEPQRNMVQDRDECKIGILENAQCVTNGSVPQVAVRINTISSLDAAIEELHRNAQSLQCDL